MPSAGAGDFRRRVTFAIPNQVSDEFGNVTTGWLDQFTTWANITPRLGGETVESARLTGRQPVIIRVRQTTDTRKIRTDWKATDNTDPANPVDFNIRTAVDPNLGDAEHGKWIDMLAEHGVAI